MTPLTAAMTPLQTRLHTEVCLPTGLTACLCGSYARVGEEWAKEQVADNCPWPPEPIERKSQLDAARERETRLRDALRSTSDHRCYDGACWCENHYSHDVKNYPNNIAPHGDTCQEVRVALSAGAGEK